MTIQVHRRRLAPIRIQPHISYTLLNYEDEVSVILESATAYRDGNCETPDCTFVGGRREQCEPTRASGPATAPGDGGTG